MEKLQRIAYGTLFLGLLLIIGGKYYPNAGNPDTRWPMASEEELEATRLKFHGLSYKHAGAEGAEDEAKVLAELNAAEKAYNAMGVKRDWAVDGPNVTGGYLYWSGIVVATVGIFMLIGSRTDD
ncbi:MAG: hypothetical protein ACI9G1_004118 [Pirellulaceae bacterium]|jgi:hypothetical protein